MRSCSPMQRSGARGLPMSNHPRIEPARKNSLARRLSAVLAAILLCESVKAQQTDQVQTDHVQTDQVQMDQVQTDQVQMDQVQMDEVMVSAQKQTALDSEAISLSATPDAEPP